MKIAAIIASLEDYLKPLVTAEGGIISVVETAEDAMEMLAGTAPEKWRLVLSTDGEKAPEDDGRAGHVVSEIVAYVQAPKGMETKPGRSLHRRSTNNGKPFLDRLNWVIRKLRAVTFDNDEIDEQQALNYRGWEWLKYQDQPAWRTAKATFELLYVHDDPATDPDPDSDNLIVPSSLVISGVAEDPAFYIISAFGVAVGRIQRYAPEEGDPGGTGTGYRIVSPSSDGGYYIVALSGIPDGRIPVYAL